MRRLRIIVPALDEEQRIEPTIRDYCDTFSDRARIVVVANGCVDGTARAVRRLQDSYPNLELIEIANRIGKGGAVRAGLATGSEEVIGFVDADGSTSAAEYLKLYRTLETSSYDAVIGSRWMRGSVVHPAQALARRVASRGFNRIIRTLFGFTFSDTQCGAKLFTRAAVQEVLRVLEVADFAFDIELLWRLKRAGLRIAEVPTVWSDRQHGSKVQLLSSSHRMLWTVLRLRLRESAFWRVPFVDRLARRSVIPVKRHYRALILGARLLENDIDPDLAALFSSLRASGLELVDVATETSYWPLSAAVRLNGAFGKAAFLMWYIFASRRDFDSIVEIGDRTLGLIPWFSMKPTFIVATGEPRHRIQSIHRKLYRRSVFVDLARDDPMVAAGLIASTTLRSGPYPAVFLPEGDSLSIRCFRGTDEPEHQILR